MTYIKNLHIDELRDELGNVTQEGTTVTAAKLNHIEDGIEDVDLRVSETEAALGEAGTALTEHMGEAAPHGATVAATADKLMIRDEAGRSQVEDPAAAKDIVNKQTLETAVALVIPKATNTSGTDAYALAIQGITAYTDGLTILMRTSVANAGAASLNINGLGVRPIRTFRAGIDADINTGEIPANSQVMLCYSSAAVSGAGGFVVLNIRDADMVRGIRLRYNASKLEYSTDDVTWASTSKAAYYSAVQQNYTPASVAWGLANLFLPGAVENGTYTLADVFSSDAASEALVLDPVGLEAARTRPEGIHRYIAKKAGVTVSNFDSCADLAASAAACTGILASTEAMDAVVSMPTAYSAFVASATAMNLFAQNSAMLTRLFANYTIREAMFDSASAFTALQTYARAWMVANVQVTSSGSVASASQTWKGLSIAKVIGLELTVSGTATKRHATWKTPECADIGDGSLTNQFAKLTTFDFSYWSSGTSYTATATAKYVQMCP